MRRAIVLASLALSLALAACTSIYQVRGTEDFLEPINLKNDFVGDSPQHRALQISMDHQSVERFTDFSLGIIEINDDGAVNPAQKAQVMEMVQEETQEGGLLVVFAHGWHHGPQVCDRDLACFRAVLSRLKAERARRNEPGNVVGVFLGWRGESIARKGLSLATIWDRKRTAEHIGRTAGKEILIELNQVWIENDGLTMVSIGHSLGGAFLFSAVKSKLTGNVGSIELQKIRTYRVARAQKDRRTALNREVKALRAGFGDLVVLVNPAIEASEYKVFDNDLIDRRAPQSRTELVKERLPYDKNHPYDRRQLPVLMVVASRADSAVGTIFPIARSIGGIGTLRWKYLANPIYLKGMGRYAPQVTHDLFYPEDQAETEKQEREEPEQAKLCGCSKMTEAKVDIQGAMRLGVDSQQLGKMTFSVVEDRQKKRGWDENSPYLVVQTSRGVIREHSDIFNPVFVGFLSQYINAYDQRQEEFELAAPVAGIKAVDIRFHGTSTPVSRKPIPGSLIGEPLFPQPLRLKHSDYAEAWRELFGTEGKEVESDYVRAAIKQRSLGEQGASYTSWILDRAGIEIALAEEPMLAAGLSPPRFHWVAPADLLTAPSAKDPALADLIRQAGFDGLPETLEEYSDRVVRFTLDRWRQRGAVAVKLTGAPSPQGSSREPALVYRDLAAGKTVSEADTAVLADALSHTVAREAAQEGLVVHLQAAAGAKDPRLLTSFFDDPSLKDTKFVLIEGGWPFEMDLDGLLEKPNVYVALSDWTLRRIVRERDPILKSLLSRHSDKILFGSNAQADLEEPLGGWEERQWLFTKAAREAIASTLSELVADGELEREEAIARARKALRDNAMSLYRLGGR